MNSLHPLIIIGQKEGIRSITMIEVKEQIKEEELLKIYTYKWLN